MATCNTCGDSGTYYVSTHGSCRDDGDGWRFCDCLAGARRALANGGTCFMMSLAGSRLIRAGARLSDAEYKRYKQGAEWMEHEVLPNPDGAV